MNAPLPDGTVMTRADFLSKKTWYQVASRKAAVILAVLYELTSRPVPSDATI
ncbi:MAG: DUF1153 domain-containing protein [Rhodobacteraceae bacterium]|nr:DUF1153 domain-containing protein [Paracoccaceae bacterium]